MFVERTARARSLRASFHPRRIINLYEGRNWRSASVCFIHLISELAREREEEEEKGEGDERRDVNYIVIGVSEQVENVTYVAYAGRE